MGLLPSRMQIADEGISLGAKVERKAMPTVAEKQKYAHSAFEMNDHQPDGTIKPTMLVSFSKMVEDMQAGLDAMAEHCAKNAEQENPLFATFCTELDKRAGIESITAETPCSEINRLLRTPKGNETVTGMRLLMEANRQREDAYRKQMADVETAMMRSMVDAMMLARPPQVLMPLQYAPNPCAMKQEALRPWKVWAAEPDEPKRDMTDYLGLLQSFDA